MSIICLKVQKLNNRQGVPFKVSKLVSGITRSVTILKIFKINFYGFSIIDSSGSLWPPWIAKVWCSNTDRLNNHFYWWALKVPIILLILIKETSFMLVNTFKKTLRKKCCYSPNFGSYAEQTLRNSSFQPSPIYNHQHWQCCTHYTGSHQSCLLSLTCCH